MRILMYSEKVAPSIGGVEEVTRLVGQGLVDLGCEVTIVTAERSPTLSIDRATVISRPGPARIYSLARRSDGVITQGLALKFALPAVFANRPMIVVRQIHTPFRRRALSLVSRVVESRMKRLACSKFMASIEQGNVRSIRNPYDSSIFRHARRDGRTHDLLWVGRMIEEKGPQLLIDAWLQMRSQNASPSLTFIGTGPLEGEVRRFVEGAGINSNVRFLGPMTGKALADEMRSHRILVVPSIWDEPFGIVALEGIACGCIVVGADVGGLPEAIGPCGLTFPRGDTDGLTTRLLSLLNDENSQTRFSQYAESHLAPHHPTAVATSYLNVLLEMKQGNVGVSSQEII